jgi:AraC-like DNA-binding protein
MRAEALIEERYRGPLRVIDVAAEIGCSASALRSYFATFRNTSPRAYLKSVRMRHAMAFIRNSTLTLQAIAEQCGFDSSSHLSRRVKEVTQQSPGRLRRSVASQNGNAEVQ